MDTNLNIIIFLLCIMMTVTASKDLSNGWGNNIRWVTLEQAQKESRMTGNPIMLIIHKSWCGACKALGPKFRDSQEIAELSKYFVMVNTIDDDEPKDRMYAPDGAYVPRILIISQGEVQEDLIHENGNPKYKYYYHAPAGIVETMKKAIYKNHGIMFNDLSPLHSKL